MDASRREFLAATLAGGAALLGGCKLPAHYPGSILGASSADGHRLREGSFPRPTETLETEFAVVGGGVAGLAAARVFAEAGKDFLLLELEKETGGNAASGHNAVSAYPWGAHYVPIPNSETVEVLALFSELGLITGHDSSGFPIYDEFALCFDPTERLYLHGRWQEGLVPQIGITARDRQQYDSFFSQMETWRAARGSDGRRAFAIPVDLSSGDQELRKLDLLTMKDFMDQRGWNSPPLRWYVDYCCRDDYGAGFDKVSAWAGAHYFASRNGQAANAPRDSVLTWPEGNGWLVRRMAEPLRAHIHSRCLVWNIESTEGGVLVDYFDLAGNRSVRIHAKGAVCAAPRFVAQRIVSGMQYADVEYSPWMVANVTLGSLPEERGAALSWDNAFYDSESLGYVVATHQGLDRVPRQTVLTHYWPLDGHPPKEARGIALARSHESWRSQIVADLRFVHPGIEAEITRLDVWLWGHGMVRPVPGFIWGETRRRMLEPLGQIRFAHSDMSGISIFEEAFTRGVHAARDLLGKTA